MMQTSHFWWAFADTVRGWALGLGFATVLAVPIGIVLGSSDFAASAFRVPIEFLRPIPSAALIPVLFLTLGTNLKSEVFLAAFGAFWPLLVQTMYGVRDVDPSRSTPRARSASGGFERLYRITLPSARPVHRDRAAHRLGGRADPRLHRRALHGHPGPRPGRQLRESYGLERAALRARARDRLPRARDPLPLQRRSSGAPALAPVTAAGPRDRATGR